MPRKEFESFTRLDASDVNTFLMDQAVMSFAGTAARGSAITTPTEGMLTYLADSDSFEFFDGTSFLPLATEGPTVEYLVIAGGAGGSCRSSGNGGGAGGAGGYRTNVSGALSGGSVVAELPIPLVAGTYPITVGAGGAGTPTDNSVGGLGSYSVFTNISCIGGSFGRLSGNTNAVGGSGGGGSQSLDGSNGFFQQGFKGGQATSTGGGGGGGAGQAGVNATTASGSAGGAGLASSITGSSVTRAGGGGGGGGTGGSLGAGGTGGGGDGAVGNNTAGSGTVNTGGGGGGASSGTSGAGGSGVVIFSVPTGTSVSFSGGVTETNSTVGDKQVYIVTATSTTSETVTFA
jgi:hypothetical protein